MNNGAECYRRFLSGDKTGLEEIIRLFSDNLTLYICKITGNIDEAREIMTETFVELYVNKPKYSEKSSFKTWLYSIARFTAFDYLKNKNKYNSINEDELNQLPDIEDLESKIIVNEEKSQLCRAIDKLQSEYKQVIYLMYFEGFDTSETAKIMKKSKKQVGDLLYRAKQSLKKIIEKEGNTYEGLL